MRTPSTSWDKQGEFQMTNLLPYFGGDPSVFKCPAAKKGLSTVDAYQGTYTHAVNGKPYTTEYKLNDDGNLFNNKPLTSFEQLRRVPLMADYDEHSDRTLSRHGKGVQIVFMDGHVELVNRDKLKVGGQFQGWGWVRNWVNWK